MSESTLTLVREGKSSSVPLVLIHDGGGTIFAYCTLGDIGRTLYGISNPHFDDGLPFDGGIPEVARLYVAMIKAEIPSGRILLGGWSFGGVIAVEISRVLASDPDLTVVGLVMIDSPYPPAGRDTSNPPSEDWRTFLPPSKPQLQAKIDASIRSALDMMSKWPPPRPESEEPAPTMLVRAVLVRARDYLSKKDAESAHLPRIDRVRDDPKMGWEQYDPGFVQAVFETPGNHYTMFSFDYTNSITQRIVQACSVLDRK